MMADGVACLGFDQADATEFLNADMRAPIIDELHRGGVFLASRDCIFDIFVSSHVSIRLGKC